MSEIDKIYKTGDLFRLVNTHIFPDSLNTKNQEKEASILRVARGSLTNRSHERRRCAIPPERCCTPVIRERGGTGICAIYEQYQMH
jgi:hypothetical protein